VAKPDDPLAIAAAITLAVVGISFFMGMPVIVGAWSEYGGFSDQQAGWLASADIAGLVVASLSIANVINFRSRRQLALTGSMIAILANILAMGVDQLPWLLALRFMAGLGGGALYALGLAGLAATRQTTRNYAILMFAQVSIGILVVNIYPALAALAGIKGIYLGMCAAFLVGLLVLPRLPAHVPVQSLPDGSDHRAIPPIMPWLCLTAFFVFYLTVGSFWAYIERIGIRAGLGENFVLASLTYTQVLSLPSCVAAGWLAGRLGQQRPLIVSLAIGAMAILTLAFEVSQLSYAGVLIVFFLVWNPIDIYQLGILGNIDHSGRYVAMVPAFQGSANALGPVIGGLMLANEGGYQQMLMTGAFCMLVALAIYVFLGTAQRFAKRPS
jgi:predicted MFS family arabinose efflux permease